MQPKAEQAAFRTAWHPPLARQFHTSRHTPTPPHCCILLCEADAATSTFICALQLVASDSGPTTTGVTTATLQQYLYQLCQAVAKVGTAIKTSLHCVPALLAPSNTLIQQHQSATSSAPLSADVMATLLTRLGLFSMRRAIWRRTSSWWACGARDRSLPPAAPRWWTCCGWRGCRRRAGACRRRPPRPRPARTVPRSASWRCCRSFSSGSW